MLHFTPPRTQLVNSSNLIFSSEFACRVKIQNLFSTLFVGSILAGGVAFASTSISDQPEFIESAKSGGKYYLSNDLIFDNNVRTYFEKETEIDGKALNLTAKVGISQGLLYVTGENSGHPGAHGDLVLKNFGDLNGLVAGGELDEALIPDASGIYGLKNSKLLAGNGGRLKVDSSLIQNNEGSMTGVFQLERGGSLTLTNSVVYNNKGTTSSVILALGNPGDVILSGTTFLKNQATGGYGTVYVESSSSLFIHGSYFQENKSLSNSGSGGGIYATNERSIVIESSIFKENFAQDKGGAIYTDDSAILIVEDSTFEGNTAGNHGAAIYLEAPSSENYIVAHQGDVLFSGNKLLNGDAEAIYLASSEISLNLNAWLGRSIVFDDKIVAASDSEGNRANLILNAAGAQYSNNGEIRTNQDATGGTIVFNNEVENVNLHFHGGTLQLTGKNTDKGILGSSVLHLDGEGVITTVDDFTKTVLLGGLQGNSSARVMLDVNLETQGSDFFSLADGGFIDGNASFAVDGWNVLADATDKVTIVELADENLKDRFSLAEGGTTAQGKIFSYDVSRLDDGNYEFLRKGSDPENINPDIYAGDTALAGIGVVDHLINTTLLSRRMTGGLNDTVGRGANWWAALSANDLTMSTGNFHDVDYQYTVGILGYTTDPSQLGEYLATYSFYGAFVDGSHEYVRNDIQQNAALIGAAAEFEKDDFWVAVHAKAGYMNSRLKFTTGSREENTPWFSLVSALGTTVPFGRFEFIPHVMGSWLFAVADDYHTPAGVSVENNNVHITELSPGATISTTLGESWKAHLTARYNFVKVWGDETYADGMMLEDIHFENYAEYGLGIEKLSDFWQASMRIERSSDGRQGWAGFAHINFVF